MIASAPDYELEELASLVEEFATGSKTFDEFRSRATRHGLYPQRQKGKYFVRLRVPCGIIAPIQLELVALAAEQWGGGVCHITTRQALEIHNLSLKHVVPLLRALEPVGVTAYESGGGTVRNIMLCPHAGAGNGDCIHVTQGAGELVHRLQRHPCFQALPRKVKIGISCCEQDCVKTLIQDIGFQARRERKKAEGFRVVVGGGLGASPKVGRTLFDFVPSGDMALVAEAVLAVFNRLGDRENRRRGRLKFLVEGAGIEKLRECVMREMKRLRRERPAPERAETPREWTGDESGKWLEFPAAPGAEDATIRIQIPGGNVDSARLKQIAWITWAHGISVRLAPEQAMLFRGIRPDILEQFAGQLEAMGFVLAHRGGLIACPGRDTCPNAYTFSAALGRELRRAGLWDSAITIKISGCSNGCSQHAIADIGLEGLARRVEGRLLPAYRIWLGGRANQHAAQFGEKLGVFPAAQLPNVIRDLLTFYQGARMTGETLAELFARLGRAPFVQIMERHAKSSQAKQPRALWDESFGGADPDDAVAPGDC